MSCPRSACTSPTRSVTPTAPQKYPNSRSLQRSPWNCSWLQTFWIAKNYGYNVVASHTFRIFEYLNSFAITSFETLFLHLAFCRNFISIKRFHFNVINWYGWLHHLAQNLTNAPPAYIFPHLSSLIKTCLVRTLLLVASFVLFKVHMTLTHSAKAWIKLSMVQFGQTQLKQGHKKLQDDYQIKDVMNSVQTILLSPRKHAVLLF